MNPVSRFGYNDYMAYHYAFIMKVATVRNSIKAEKELVLQEGLVLLLGTVLSQKKA